MPENKLEQRVINLEEKLAHEHFCVKQLNEVVVELRIQLELLEKTIKTQNEKIATLQQNSAEDMPHEKPPHY